MITPVVLFCKKIYRIDFVATRKNYAQKFVLLNCVDAFVAPRKIDIFRWLSCTCLQTPSELKKGNCETETDKT